MAVSRRHFLRGGVAAFTVGFAAPQFLSDLALAQGASARTLVVLYLGGGNDSLGGAELVFNASGGGQSLKRSATLSVATSGERTSTRSAPSASAASAA